MILYMYMSIYMQKKTHRRTQKAGCNGAVQLVFKKAEKKSKNAEPSQIRDVRNRQEFCN